MNNKLVKQKNVGHIMGHDNVANLHECCEVHFQDHILNYRIWFPGVLYNYLIEHAFNPLAIGFALAFLLRLQWKDIVKLTFEDVIRVKDEGLSLSCHERIQDAVLDISIRIYYDGKLLIRMVRDLIAYQMMENNFELEDLLTLPVVSKKNNPKEPAKVEELEEFSRMLFWQQKIDPQTIGVSFKTGGTL